MEKSMKIPQKIKYRLLAKMEAQVDTLCLLAQPKEGQQQFKNKNQPELTENRTVWKSDNQGDNETFIQTCRRGRDEQPGGEDSWQGGGWWTQGCLLYTSPSPRDLH